MRNHFSLIIRTCSLCIFLLSCSTIIVNSQNITISGVVIDSSTNSPVNSAFVYSSDKKHSTITDEEGGFSISSKSKKLYVTHVAYVPREILLDENITKSLIIYLQPLNYEAEEVIVTQQNTGIKNEIGITHLNRREIQLIPSLTGSEDILGAFLLTPGVQSVNEGLPGIYVRGSAPGQNLILLDNVTIYNPNHLLGFFPSINSFIVNSADIYKGPAPAQFGGRTSAFIDITSQKGSDSLSGEIQSGMLLSALNLSTPLFNDNTKLMVAGRMSYFTPLKNVLLQKIVNNTEDIFNNTSYDFNDLFIKLESKLFNKHNFSFFRFSSADTYDFYNPDANLNIGFNWGNNVMGVEISNPIKSNLYLTNTVGYSAYNFNMSSGFINYRHKIRTSINNPSFKSKLSWSISDHFINIGTELNLYVSKPNNLTIEVDSNNYYSNATYYGRDGSLYINDSWNITSKLNTNIGFRYTLYQQTGPYDYVKTNPLNTNNDSIAYVKNEIIQTYHTVDPRLTLSYKIRDDQLIKGGLSINTQNLHLITVGSVSLPMDIIIPGTHFIEPERSYQFNVGYERYIKKFNLFSSIECYYKHTANQIELLSSLTINYSDDILPNILSYGIGKAYGIELLLKKQAGKFQGWIGYTLSKSTRNFEELNNSKPFPFKYDRIHDLSTTITYNLTDNLTLSSVFIYATGNALTLPIGRGIFQGTVLNDYSDINAFRVKSYHRMDISATYNFENKLFNFFNTNISLSIYNLYNRKNVYYMLFIPEGDPRYFSFDIKIEEISLYPIIPSISLKMNF